MKYQFSPPKIVQKLFDDFIWSTSNDKILLTFDDGPVNETTPKILDMLNTNRIKAVFFCVGSNILKNPGLAERIIHGGHTIANHTMNHKLLTKMSREESLTELSVFNNLMKDKFGYVVKYFRPAHGRFNLGTNSLLKKMNLKCVMWNLLSYDFENNREKVQFAIDNYLAANSIVVFHDSLKCKEIVEDVLRYTISQVQKKGFIFGEPEDCLK